MDSFKKSFKSQNTRHGHRLSSSSAGAPTAGASCASHEELPILSDVQRESESPNPPPCSPADTNTHQGPRTTRGGSSGRVSRDRSVEFWRTSGEAGPDSAQDPPSRLIGQFLQKQNESMGEVALDMDLDMDELRGVRSPPTARSASGLGRPCQDRSSDLLRVSFEHLISGQNSTTGSSEDSSRGSGE